LHHLILRKSQWPNRFARYPSADTTELIDRASIAEQQKNSLGTRCVVAQQSVKSKRKRDLERTKQAADKSAYLVTASCFNQIAFDSAMYVNPTSLFVHRALEADLRLQQSATTASRRTVPVTDVDRWWNAKE
jgi:hypothetical protein